MKQITFICNHLFGGGAERVLTSLANYFDNKGYKVSIISFNGKERYPINKTIKVTEIGDTSSLIKQSKAIRSEHALISICLTEQENTLFSLQIWNICRT